MRPLSPKNHVHRYGTARIGRQINLFEFEIAFEFLEKSGFGIKTGGNRLFDGPPLLQLGFAKVKA